MRITGVVCMLAQVARAHGTVKVRKGLKRSIQGENSNFKTQAFSHGDSLSLLLHTQSIPSSRSQRPGNTRRQKQLSSNMPTRRAIEATSPCVEMVGCQFSLPSHHITVLLVYRSPSSTESDDDIVLRVLRTVARLNGEYLILGDFNAPDVNWLTRACSISNPFSTK